ncbi:MAG: formyltransferase family protein [Phycisphaerales bacterium]|nr:phosphoribosylglycinamide formyltransferase [Planctomycetaceae bacterium]MDP7086211.1 formyltransferase family protein [Phycisphaerales bacterium]MDP7189114.1 formyltransferase family protein [Phycisphaerales bacterium]HCA39577.1 phosphoribosylglycinamide formyltransferase [Phycisphaerales bacterium]HJN80702.1 formyltransferase family protein [Phycisphaerales bacterium]
MTNPLRLCCLASGGGRTVMNLQDHIEAGELPAIIESVILSRSGLPAGERCAARGLRVCEPAGTDSVDDWVLAILQEGRPDLICLCGYLRLLPILPWMIHRVVNIHPALLPNFGGKGMHGRAVHEAVLASGRRESGCTVHLVDARYDHGATILQRTCEVLPTDDADTLAARVFEEECAAYPAAIRLIAEGRVRIGDGPVEIAQSGHRWPDALGHSPA